MKLKKLFTTAICLTLLGAAWTSMSAQADEKKYLTIKGSDTMVHLAATWAEAYMKANPGANISVTGGGSGTGIAALLNGSTDICAASRKIKSKEVKLAEQKNIMPNETVVARDGISVVINPNNPVNELSVEQIGKMYTGAYTNWSQVGGPDRPIIALSRESSSGTYVFFQKAVLKKQDYTPRARLMPATSAIVQSVSQDQWAIGYVGLGYAIEAGKKIKILNIKADAKSKAITPSEKTVAAGEYSIARPLQLYTNGQPSGMIKKFLEFCLSEEGQKIVRETGYVPVGDAS